MSEKADVDTHLVAIIDKQTMKKIEKLAARYGVQPEEVLVELIKMEASERPEGAALH